MSKFTYNRIKEVLAKRGKKNVELARYMNVDPRVVSGWCRNVTQPGYERLFRISDFLEVEARDLISLKADLREVKAGAKTSRTPKKKAPAKNK